MTNHGIAIVGVLLFLLWFAACWFFGPHALIATIGVLLLCGLYFAIYQAVTDFRTRG